MGFVGFRGPVRTGAVALLAVLLAALAACGAGPAAEPTPPPAAAVDEGQAKAYFLDLAFSAEYGGDAALHRWEKPIHIEVLGAPTEQDLATLNALIDGLSGVPGLPPVIRVAQGGNVRLSFVPLGGLKNAGPGYVASNWGFFRSQYGADGAIDEAWVGIATDVTSQEERNHLILEEMTQMLGLFNDSDAYEDSIFYGPWTQTQRLSELDWAVLRLLYSARLRPGMTRRQAEAALP